MYHVQNKIGQSLILFYPTFVFELIQSHKWKSVSIFMHAWFNHVKEEDNDYADILLLYSLFFSIIVRRV